LARSAVSLPKGSPSVRGEGMIPNMMGERR
jgi:hypothetical protein